MIVLLFQSLLVVIASEFNKRIDCVSIWNETDSIINTETLNVDSRVLFVSTSYMMEYHFWVRIWFDFWDLMRFKLMVWGREQPVDISNGLNCIRIYSNLVKQIISFETSPLVDCVMFETMGLNNVCSFSHLNMCALSITYLRLVQFDVRDRLMLLLNYPKYRDRHEL